MTAVAGTAVIVLALVGLAACGDSSSTTSVSPSEEVLVTAEPTEGPIPLPTPTVAGTILFMQGVDEYDADICVVKADGTGLKTLAGGPDWQERPSWSPDGAKIVYDSGTSGAVMTARIWVMNADGSGKAKLSGGNSFHARWSPDGKQIVFVKYTKGAREEDVFVMNADGTGEKCVVGLKDGDGHPQWAKTGKIIFVRYQDLYSVNPDGSGLVRLTKREDVRDYAVSPDGRTLAYDDGDRIVAVPLSGGGKRVVLLSPKTDYVTRDGSAAMAWTPNGKALVVSAGDGTTANGSRLYIVNADGTGLSAVPGIETALDPACKPK